MCVVAFRIQPLSRYPFIFIGNRDERYQRPHPHFSTYPSQLPYDRAKKASALFIQDPSFGTVATTAILVDCNYQVTMMERRYTPQGFKDEPLLTITLTPTEAYL